MPTYRTKPLTIEAEQWFKLGDHPDVERRPSKDPNCPFGIVDYQTAFPKPVMPGDWVVSDGSTRHLVIKPELFDRLFEPS